MRARLGSGVAGLLALACDTAPSDAAVSAAVLVPPGEVRLYRDDGAGFAPAGRAPLAGLTSLDAHAEGDTVYVAGLSHRLAPGLLAERFPQLFVVVTETSDPLMQAWSAHAWRVDAPGRSLIDPALVTGPDGRELWFVQVDGGGDPAEGGKLSSVVRTRWDGDRFGSAEVMYEGRGVVDPSPVYVEGAWRLFLTRDHREIVEVRAGAKEARVVAGGLTVPHASVRSGRVFLTAQDTSAGPARAVQLEEREGTWTAPGPLLPAREAEPCTSPSTVARAGVRWLFCAQDRPGGGG
jgi:hypothetical protein